MWCVAIDETTLMLWVSRQRYQAVPYQALARRVVRAMRWQLRRQLGRYGVAGPLIQLGLERSRGRAGFTFTAVFLTAAGVPECARARVLARMWSAPPVVKCCLGDVPADAVGTLPATEQPTTTDPVEGIRIDARRHWRGRALDVEPEDQGA